MQGGLERATGEKMVLNFGPQHPATHGTLRIVLELDGESVLKATPHAGYLHTGFEKLGEHLDYNQYIVVTDRMNYLSPLSNNFGYVLAVEQLLGIEVPKRCQYIRLLMAELSRVADHLLWLGTAALDLGAFSVFLYSFREREKLYSIFEKTTGARLTTSYTRVGGVLRDLYDGVRKMSDNSSATSRRHSRKRIHSSHGTGSGWTGRKALDPFLRTMLLITG